MATYYISTNSINSSDLNDGLSPNTAWRTTGKITTTNILPGDIIFLKRGELYDGFVMNKSGTLENPIKFGAYGTGENPRLNSFIILSGYTDEGGGVYSYQNNNLGTNLKLLLFNQNVQPKGRLPKSGYWTISGNSIADNSVSSNSIVQDWTGGQVVIRKNDFIIDTYPITSTVGNTINYSGGEGNYLPKQNYGLFIQNHSDCLTELGDWYYDSNLKKVFIYFGLNNPNDYEVKIPLQGHAIDMSNQTHIEIQDIDFEGFNLNVIEAFNAEHIKIQNFNMNYVGQNGFVTSSYSSNNIILKDGIIKNCLNTGIYTQYTNTDILVDNVKVENCGIIPGGSESYSNGDSKNIGICVQGGLRNKVINSKAFYVGFNGIVFNGNASECKNNIVHDFALIKNDAAGIYMYIGVPLSIITEQIIITENIVYNGIGNIEGTPSDNQPVAHGYYLDDNVNNVKMFQNLGYDNANSGVYLHNAFNNYIHNNLFYGNKNRQILFEQNNSLTIRDNIVLNNTFVTNEIEQTLLFANSSPFEIPLFGEINGNRYISIGQSSTVFNVAGDFSGPYSFGRTFNEWKTISINDSNSIFTSLENDSYDIVQELWTANYSDILPGGGQGQQTGSNGDVSVVIANDLLTISRTGGSSRTVIYINAGPVEAGKYYELDIQTISGTRLTYTPETMFENPLYKSKFGGKQVYLCPTTRFNETIMVLMEADFTEAEISSMSFKEVIPTAFNAKTTLVANTTDSNIIVNDDSLYFIKNLENDAQLATVTLLPGEYIAYSETTNLIPEPVDPDPEPEETNQALIELINQLQYYIGQKGYEIISKNKNYDTPEFALLEELVSVLQYFDSINLSCKQYTNEQLDGLIDFFEARYNLNNLPYIEYTSRITNILKGDGVPGSMTSNCSGIEDVPLDNKLYGRKNRTWSEIPSAVLAIDQTFINNANTAFSWGDHALAGYALTSQLHNAVTLGTTNGLSIVGQVLSLALATTLNAGAMSAADKVKLDTLAVHDAVTLGTSNGLSLSGQQLSLGLATNLVAGAMSAADKIKLTSLVNYTHPTGFTNQPTVALTGANVISQITVNNEGHVTGVSTRALTLANLGIVKGDLTKVNDTNITLTLGGTPTGSLFENVSLTLGWTGLLDVIRGGIGVGTLNTGEVLIGNGTSPVTTISRSGIDTRATFPASTHTLTSHSDVSLTNPQAGEVLVFQAGLWKNSTVAAAGITFTELDPVFVAWRDTARAANTFYAGPNGSLGIPSFRTLVLQDIPNIYVRFDTNAQGLNSTQKENARTNIGAQTAFDAGNVVGDSIITLTNALGRVIGIDNLTIEHAVSGWSDKVALTGANIISNLTVDAYGHISDWTTRVLTLEDLGFVAFDPSTIEATLLDHESRITALELAFPLLNDDKNYVHEQVVSAAIWTINHNLGKKPSVTIIDSAGSMIFAKLTYTDLNNIEIDFAGQLTSGEAILN